ncbi:hypothetical protein K9M79_08905 [Candidatus Woesearchaeota archaeon]|nr:hypothetical protein [Candidatus Woesearchaeota archaeon]
MDKISAKMCSIFIGMVIGLGLLVTVNASGFVSESRILGMAVFSDYIDDKGLQLYEFANESNESVVAGSKLNLGKFYRDILRVQGDSDILTNCTDVNTSFSECINEFAAEDIREEEFNRTMEHIDTAVDFGQEHGINYRSVPFIRDLLG